MNARNLPAPLPTPSQAGRYSLLLLGVAMALALGGLAGAISSGEPYALAAGAAVLALPLLALAGRAGLDLLLASVLFAALAFFTAIRHRSTLDVETPHPFYEWALWRVTLPEMLAVAALAATLLRTPSRADEAPVRVGAVPWLIGGFLALGLFSGLGNGNTLEACLRDGRKVVYVVVAHLLIVRIVPSAARRTRLLQVIGLALLAGALATVGAWWSDRGFHYNGTTRASVDVSDFLGFLGLIALPMAALRSRAAHGSLPLRLLLIAAGAAATICTFSRAAWCAAPIALAVVALHPAQQARRSTRALTLLVVAVALLAPFLFSGIAEQAWLRLAPLFDPAGDPSVNYRVRELRGAFAVAADHPLAGVGLGSRFDAGAALIDRRRGSATLVHNLFVWSAVKAGLPGLLLLCAALLLTVKRLSDAARRHVDPRAAALALGLLGVLAGFLVIGQVGAMLNQARTAFLLGTVTGLAQLLAAGIPAERVAATRGGAP
ncbi:MAG: O-antigen ligase family protein [Planctomycetes bacterium]|nr:O-antigen ligase family protein [Planctomycetota bacterium]